MDSVINSYSNSFKLVIGIYPNIVHKLIKKKSSTGHCQHYYFHCVFIVDTFIKCKKQNKIKRNKNSYNNQLEEQFRYCIWVQVGL